MEKVDFGKVIEALKEGKRATREGWNGKQQFIILGKQISYIRPDGQIEVAFHEDIGSKCIIFVGTRGQQAGWLASQSDMLAEDWIIFE